MAVKKDKNSEEDVLEFVKTVCPNCIAWKLNCERKKYLENKNYEWFEMCPKFFNWKHGIVTLIDMQAEHAETHKEEIEAQHQKYLERVKADKEKKKAEKKKQKETTKKTRKK